MDPLYKLAMDYHYETERYDRLRCTGGISKYGCAMPRTEQEHRDINSNAREVRRRIIEQGVGAGIPASFVHKAIGEFAHMFNYEDEHQRREQKRQRDEWPPQVISPAEAGKPRKVL